MSQKDRLKQLILEDCKRYKYNFNLYLGQEVSQALAEEAHSAIKDFYTSYHPNYYVRHYNFWRSYRKINRIINGTRTAGIELLIDSFPDDYIKKSTQQNIADGTYKSSTKFFSYSMQRPEDVFYRVIYGGWHGIASLQGRAPTMTPSPYQRIIEKRKEIIKNQAKYIQRAYDKADKDKYDYLSF